MPCDCPVDIYVLFKDTLIGASALAAVVVAASGLKTWNAQLKGTVEYDLTRRLLRGTYKLRDSFSVVRNPIMWANEFVPVPPDFKGSDEDARYYGMSAAYEKRWNHVVEARRELETELLEGEVIWDRTLRDRYAKLFQLQQELIVYLNTHLRIQDPKARDSTRDSYSEVLRERRDVLYEGGSQEDEFARDLAAAVAQIEEHLKPHLRK